MWNWWKKVLFAHFTREHAIRTTPRTNPPWVIIVDALHTINAHLPRSTTSTSVRCRVAGKVVGIVVGNRRVTVGIEARRLLDALDEAGEEKE